MPGLTASFEARGGWVLTHLAKEFTLTTEQASGIVGNLGGESGLKAVQEIENRGDRGGYGWAQWTGPRRVAFENWCAAQNLDVASDEANYRYLVVELHTTQLHAIAQLQKTTTVEAAVFTFEAIFERPANLQSGLAARTAFARQAIAGSIVPPEPVPVPAPIPTPVVVDAQIEILNKIWTWCQLNPQVDMTSQFDKLDSTLEKIMAAIDDLEAKVTAEETVEASAITLLQTIATELKDALAANDTPRLQALSAKLDTDTATLAAAVTANTPAA